MTAQVNEQALNNIVKSGEQVIPLLVAPYLLLLYSQGRFCLDRVNPIDINEFFEIAYMGILKFSNHFAAS